MSLDPGVRLGPYEILTPIGAGGMGEVYRARDTKLDRDVALKVLPEVFVADPERVARFQREAKALAALNHPNIATIHGLEEANPSHKSGQAVHALVMELVDGPTLADRIAHGAIPLDDALPIASQIALAVEAAHEQGIVHRDLKPANIKVRPNGAVKVLDFGLAKLASDSGSGAGRPSGLSQSPTLTSPVATLAGTILGTAAYMAPEQARGKPVDKRADIWAFGCVLFEMLTGRRAFGGDEVSDTLAFIITKDVDWRALPASTPAAIRRILRRCLEKDPAKRLHDVADARIEIDEAIASPAADNLAVAAPPPVAHTRFNRLLLVIAAASVSGAIVGAVVWAMTRPRTIGRTPPMRFALATTPLQSFTGGNPADRSIAMSPDGTHIAYISGNTVGTGMLVVRSLDRLDGDALPGTAGARSPFFSPDGKWIGFFTSGQLRKVSITGGPPLVVCGVTSAPRGASWIARDTIVFATAASQGLLSVPSEGGSPTLLTKIDSSRQEYAHFYPAVLPGQRGVLYVSMRTGGGTSPGDNADLAVLDFATGTQKMVLHGGTSPEYMPSGHLVYAVGGGLRAVHFDLGRLEVAGDPVPVLEHVSTGTFGSANFAVSQTGTLLYAPGNLQNSLSAPRSLVWVDRHGREEPIAVPPRAYTLPRLSPDGTRVALDIRDQDNDIWIFDLKRGTLERRTFDPSVDQYPVWTTDGRRILFGSIRSGLAKVFAQDADGSRPVEQLSTGGESQFPTSMSPDGKHLIVRQAATAGRFDIAMVTLGGNGVAEPLLHSAFSENNGEVSPDGHWLAYQSDESGRDEIYVRPFPNVNDGQWQVSTAGGTRPLWARNGRELFFLDSGNLLHAVAVTTSPAFSALNPVKVLSAAYFVAPPIAGRSYDVSPDGKRFLMIKDARPDTSATEVPAMVLVLNWLDELKGRLP